MKEAVTAWEITDAASLQDALQEAMSLATEEGHSPDTVVSEPMRMTLVRETLTDGSHVMNLAFYAKAA